MFNVCTLRYYQKRELCKTLLSVDRFDLQFVEENSDEKPDLSCKNILADFGAIIKESGYERVAVSAFKCPYAYKMDVTFTSDCTDHEKIFVPIRLFISGSVHINSAILYYQHISPFDTKIEALLVAFRLPVMSISSMVLDRRHMVWKRSSENMKPFNEKNVQRQVGSSDNVIRDPLRAESALIRSEEIKQLPCK